MAGIADRYNQLRTLFNTQLKVQKRVAGGVVWESGPGRIVLVGPAFLAAPLDTRVRQMLTALIAADPNISSAHKAALVELIFEIKDRTGQTFEATEGPGTRGAGGGTTGGGSASKDSASKAGAALAARPTLRLNDSGPEVVALQQLLNSFSAQPSLDPDGQFGRLTRTAVRQFQSAQGATVDGVVGPRTWSLLQGSEPMAANIDTSNTYRSFAAD